MRQNLLDLYEIQKIDLGIREHEAKRAQIPQLLRDHEAALARLTSSAHHLTEQQAQTEKEARLLQATIEDERDKIRKWEARLGDLRNQREYQALHRETEGQRRANRDNEEKLQELYKAQAAQAEQRKALDEKLAEARTRTETERAQVQEKLGALEGVMSEQLARREQLVPRVPKALFRKYDTIRPRRMGIGMCLVSDGCCVACNIRLPPQMYNTLQRGNSAEQCPSCFRIICWDRLIEDGEKADAKDAPVADAAAIDKPAADATLAHPA